MKRLWNGGKGCWDSSEIGEGIGSDFLGVGGSGSDGKEEEEELQNSEEEGGGLLSGCSRTL